MGGAYSAYEFQIAPGPGWPNSGGQVMELTVELSRDGGATWLPEASTDFGPNTAWHNPALAIFNVSVGTANGQVLTCAATDLYRFTLNVLQTCGAPVFTVIGVA